MGTITLNEKQRRRCEFCSAKLLAIMNATWEREKPLEMLPATFQFMSPHSGQSSQLFLEEAQELLSGLWPRLGERPDLEGLDRSTAAEVLLRVGALTGVIGSSNQIKDAQQTARDLISESLTIFQSQRDKKKIAEAQTELALSYWRTGEYDNASDLLKLALAHLTNEIELKARAIQRLAMVEQYARHPHEAVRFLTENSVLFEKISNQTLIGCYHQTLGDALENLWELEDTGDYLDRALVEYAAASYHFEQADHKRYRANVENNLGFYISRSISSKKRTTI